MTTAEAVASTGVRSDSFADVLEDLLSVIGSESPTMRDALTSALSVASLRFVVEEESFVLGPSGVGRPGDVGVVGTGEAGSDETNTGEGASVMITADRATVRSLIDGEVDLAGAARHVPSFDVVGRAAGLGAADRVLQLLVLGAARSPSADSFHHRIVVLCSDATRPGETR